MAVYLTPSGISITDTYSASLGYTLGYSASEYDPSVFITKVTGVPYAIYPVRTPVVMPTLPQYNLNLNTDVHKMLRNEFYYRTLDQWLWRDDMSDIMGYLKVGSKGVQLIDKLSDFSKKEETQDSMEQKVAYIEDNILTKKDVYRLLKRYVKEHNVNWFDLPKKSHRIRELMHKYLVHKLKTLIELK